MPSPLPANQHQPSQANTALTVFGVVLLLVSAVLPLLMLSMIMWPSRRGNDFGAGEMAVFGVAILFVFVSPLTAGAGLFLTHKYSRGGCVCLFGWAAALPTLIGLMGIAYCVVYQVLFSS